MSKSSPDSPKSTQRLPEIMLKALKINHAGMAEEVEVNIAKLALIFVQPGATPPSKIKDLSPAFMATTGFGFKGCTGEAKALSDYSRANAREASILSSKSMEDLKLLYEENMPKDVSAHPLAGLLLISDPSFQLAAALKTLGHELQQTLGEKEVYNKRYALKLDAGVVKEIILHNAAETPGPVATGIIAAHNAGTARGL